MRYSESLYLGVSVWRGVLKPIAFCSRLEKINGTPEIRITEKGNS
jgi:hypothetical protein